MSAIKSNDEEFRRFTDNPNQGPVVMLNLLKFKPQGAGIMFAIQRKRAPLSPKGEEAFYTWEKPMNCSMVMKYGIMSC